MKTRLIKSTTLAAVLATMLTGCWVWEGSGGDPEAKTPSALEGTVSGTVISAMTGLAISGATVRSGATRVTTAADGSYTLLAATDDRAIIAIEAEGFAETFQIARVAVGQTAALGVQLLPVGVTTSVDAATGGTVSVPDSSAQVSIPADGLVSATGAAPVGSVDVSVTPINPAIDSSVMPGDFTAEFSDGNGAPVPIESFGALLVDVRDDNGTRYNLEEGQTSTIRIPLGTLSASPPPTIPLLIFDETTGRWVEEGTATLAGTPGNLFYTGTVTSFGAWNADAPLTTVFINGCVRDTANQPVENVSVKADGVNYSGSASTFTDADGNFRVAVRRDGLVTINVTFWRDDKPVTTTVNAGPSDVDFTLTSCIETAPAPLTITARSLPAGIVGIPYNARLAATNGTKPYSWSFSGVLPTGLTLDSATGQISGTPTTAANFAGTIEVRDSSTPVQSATTPFSISVTEPAPLAITTGSPLPQGTEGTPYNTRLTATNGTRPYAWSVIAGALPNGLTLNSTTGQISGTPTLAGTAFAVTIQVEDSATPQQSVDAGFSISVTPADIIPPTVVATVPLNDASAVMINSQITATFSEAMASATLNSTTFNIAGVSGTVSYSGTGRTAIFTPSSPLTTDTRYTATITTGVQDTAGNALASNYSWSFITQAPGVPSAPTGVVTEPGDGQVTVSWNAVTGATSYNLYMASVSGVTKLNYSSLADGMLHANVTSPYVHTGLINGTTYYFVVTAVNTAGESAESAQVLGTPGSGGGGVSVGSRIAAGDSHTCALANGTVQCWGDNSAGQLGNGTRTSSSTPVQVSGITTATAIAAGTWHSCAVLANGTVQCWGYNGFGLLGNGTHTTSTTPVQVSGITTATAIAAGTWHSCARLANGTVQCWGGYNGQGQLGNGTQTTSTTPVQVSGITTATAIAVGSNHSCAVLTSGTVQCWGYNGHGQLGNGTHTTSTTPVQVSGITTATAVSVGAFHSCARLANGTVQCWGDNVFGTLGNGTSTSSSTSVAVSGISTATTVTAGSYHSCAVLTSGTVQCWGWSRNGQLGDGTTTFSSTPVAVSGITTATAVAAGSEIYGSTHSCAVLANGTVQCWGYNGQGQLGNGTTTDSLTPVQVIGLP